VNRSLRRTFATLAVLAAIPVLLLCAFVGAVAGGLTIPLQPSGATLSAGSRLGVAQIGSYAEHAGFQGDALVMAIAVALAESGGTVDRGLWQINSVHNQFSAACDYDPSCCAQAAYDISDGGRNWGPWVTFQRGEEITFIPEALAWVESQSKTQQAAP
jgi:hypothetical protein